MSGDSLCLYEQVASEIRRQIVAGTFRIGDRLPSVRMLVEQRKVSVSTVLEAYALLEGEGLVVVRPQSGYYVHDKELEVPTRCDLPVKGGSRRTESEAKHRAIPVLEERTETAIAASSINGVRTARARKGNELFMLEYERIVHYIRDEIRAGRLGLGDRIPSLRALADQFKVCMSTVIRAYESLEVQGFIESRYKSGYFVCSTVAAPIRAFPIHAMVVEGAFRDGGEGPRRWRMLVFRNDPAAAAQVATDYWAARNRSIGAIDLQPMTFEEGDSLNLGCIES